MIFWRGINLSGRICVIQTPSGSAVSTSFSTRIHPLRVCTTLVRASKSFSTATNPCFSVLILRLQLSRPLTSVSSALNRILFCLSLLELYQPQTPSMATKITKHAANTPCFLRKVRSRTIEGGSKFICMIAVPVLCWAKPTTSDSKCQSEEMVSSSTPFPITTFSNGFIKSTGISSFSFRNMSK